MCAALPAAVSLSSILGQSSSVALAVFDTRGRYLWWSFAWGQQFHLTPQAQGRTFPETWSQCPDHWLTAATQLLRGQSLHHQEHDLVHLANGEAAWLNWSAEPWRDDTGAIAGTLWHCHCVTAQVHNLTAWTELFRASPSLICVTDLGGHFQQINPSWQRVLGWSETELLDQNCLEFVHPDDRATTRAAWTRLQQGERYITFENRYRCADGHWHWLGWTATALLPQQQVYALVRDVSDRKHTQQALATHQELLQQVLDTTPQWLYVKDEQGRFVLANQAFTQALGKTPEEVIGERDVDILANPLEIANFRQADWEVLTTHEEQTLLDSQLTTHEGTQYRLHVIKRPLFLPHHATPYVLVCATDMTQYQEIEQALQASEQRYQSLMETSPVGIFYDDVSGNCLYANQQLCILTGLGFEELRHHGWLSTVHPEDRDRVIREWSLTQTERQWFQSEYRFQRPDGSVRWVYSQAQAIYDRDRPDRILGYVGTCTDVTERKLAEVELQRYKQAVDSASDAIAITNARGQVIYINPALRDLYGYESVEILQSGGGLARLFGDPSALQGIFSIVMQGQTWQHEVEHCTAAGQVLPVLLRVNAIRDEMGTIVGLVSIATDISERKAIEAKLFNFTERLQQQVNREQLLNRLLNQIRHALAAPTDEIIGVALQEIRHLLAIDRTQLAWYAPQAQPPYWEVVAEACAETAPDYRGLYTEAEGSAIAARVMNLEVIQAATLADIGDPAYQQLAASLGYGAILMVPLQIQEGPTGAIICGHGQPRTWDDPEIEFIKAVVNQLAIATRQSLLYTESEARAKALEQALYELSHTQSQLIQTEKMSSLGQLVAGIAHEINNPVNFIYGNIIHAQHYIDDLFGLVQAYQQEYPQPTEAIQAETDAIDLDFLLEDLPKLLGSIEIGAERIREIVASLRTFSRMDEAEMKAVNIHDGIESTLMILHNRLKARADNPGMEIIRNYGELPKVECYAGQLNQVFMNLLSNAIDALEEFNVENPQIAIATRLFTENIVEIAIRDNGPGIPEENLPRLFDPFFTTKEIGKGTGLGLSISYQIITEKHGGQLTCTSELGKGTTFAIRIPLQQKDP